MYRISLGLMLLASFYVRAMESETPIIIPYNNAKHQALVGALLDQYKHGDEKFSINLKKSITDSARNIKWLSLEIFTTNVCTDKAVLRGLVHYSTYKADIMCIDLANYARIEWIQVDKPGHGIGSSLLESALKNIEAQDSKIVIVDVPQSAHKAGKFFERHGFALTKTTKTVNTYHHYLN